MPALDQLPHCRLEPTDFVRLMIIIGTHPGAPSNHAFDDHCPQSGTEARAPLSGANAQKFTSEGARANRQARRQGASRKKSTTPCFNLSGAHDEFVGGLFHPRLFPVIPITDGASHFRRRHLLSMTLFWSPLKVAPKKL
jgi:hypothetical protein